jgi:hypothetical protein
MAASGATAAEIGAAFGITDETLAKYYRRELDLGRAKAFAARAHDQTPWPGGDTAVSAEDVASWLQGHAQMTSDPALRRRFAAAARILLR